MNKPLASKIFFMIRVFVLLIETVILLKKKLLKIIGTWMDSGCYFGDRRLENGSDFPKKKKIFFFFFFQSSLLRQDIGTLMGKKILIYSSFKHT